MDYRNSTESNTFTVLYTLRVQAATRKMPVMWLRSDFKYTLPNLVA